MNLLAYIGYGYYPLRVAGVAPRWPFAGVIGTAMVISFGGVLNLAELLTRPVLIAIVVCGVLLWLFAYRSQWERSQEDIRIFWRDISGSSWKSAVAFVLLALLAASFFGNIITYRFIPEDDLVAYGAPDAPANMPVYIANLKRIIANPSSEGVYAWQHMQQAMMSLRGAQIRELARHYRLIYDDGSNIVIDLDHRN